MRTPRLGLSLLAASALSTACSGAPSPVDSASPGPRSVSSASASANFGPVDPPPLGPSPSGAEADITYPFDPFSAHRRTAPVPEPLPAGVSLRLGHRLDGGYSLDHVAASPDGKRWATCNIAQDITLWDAATGLPTRKLLTLDRENGCQGMAFSPDGKRLFVAGYLEAVAIDTTSGKGELLEYVSANRGFVTDPYHAQDIAVGPTGDVVVGGCSRTSTGPVRHFSSQGQLLRSLGGIEPDLGESCAYGVAYSPDGKWIAAGNRKDTVVYKASTGAIVSRLPSDYTHAVAFSPDSRLVFAAGAGAVNAFDLSTTEATASYGYLGNRFWAEALALSTDGAIVIAPNGSGFSGFDTASRRQLWAVQGAFEGRIGVTPAGEFVSVSRYPVNVARFSAKTGERTSPYDLARHDGEITSLTFTAGDKQLLSAGKDGEVRTWSAADGAPGPTFARRPNGGTSMALPRPGTGEVVSTASTCALYRFDTASRSLLARVSLGDEPGCSLGQLAFFPDGKVAVLEGSGSLRIVDLAASRQTANISLGPNTYPTRLAISQDGSRVWILTSRALVGVDPAKGVVVSRLEIEGGDLYSMALLPDHGQAILGGHRRAVIVSLADGKLLRTINVTDSQWLVASVLPLPGKGQVALGVRKGVLLADLATGKIVRTLDAEDPDNEAWSLAVTQDGRRLAAGFYSVALVWNL